MKIPIPRK